MKIASCGAAIASENHMNVIAIAKRNCLDLRNEFELDIVAFFEIRMLFAIVGCGFDFARRLFTTNATTITFAFVRRRRRLFQFFLRFVFHNDILFSNVQAHDLIIVANIDSLVGERRHAPNNWAIEGIVRSFNHFGSIDFLVAFGR